MRLSELSEREFDALLEDALRDAGSRLYRDDLAWRERVPEHFTRAGRDAIAAMSTALVKPAKHLGFGKKLILGAALTLSAVGMVTAGAYYGSPAIRECVNTRIAAASAEAERRPMDYVIPDPWEEYELRGEAYSDTMIYKWFVHDRKQVIVEIAYNLPEGMDELSGGESVTVGDVPGVYSETEQAILLHHGGIDIYIGCWNGSREDAIAYAAALLAANP